MHAFLSTVLAALESSGGYTLRMALLGVIPVAIAAYAPGRARRRIRPVHEERIFWSRETRADLGFWVFNGLVVGPVLAGSAVLIEALMTWIGAPRFFLADYVRVWPVWLQVIAALFVVDLILYVRHRVVHTWFWPFHAVHHAAHDISWSTMGKLHPGDTIAMGVVKLASFYLIGWESRAMGLAIMIQLWLNLLNHSNLQLEYPGPFRYLFVSPNTHRWHHATDAAAHHKNFAIVFAFIDVLFGTFYAPKNRLPTRYGVLDEHGESVVDPTRYGSLLAYPFRVYARRVASLWSGSGAGVVASPAPAAEGSTEPAAR